VPLNPVLHWHEPFAAQKPSLLHVLAALQNVHVG
jgi:hypothetical protein